MSSPEADDVSLPNSDVTSPRVVCISTDVHASAALQATVAAILPMSRVDAADTSIVRGRPDAECVIVAVGSTYSAALSLVRELRARGFDKSVILVVQSPQGVSASDMAQLGVGAVLRQSELALKLPDALIALLALERSATQSPHAAEILASLRRMQSMLAAGEVASQLQHKLNNPLAALLAEAQLLELEPLSPEHAISVGRIVELCRRVIEVSRSLEGIGNSRGL